MSVNEVKLRVIKRQQYELHVKEDVQNGSFVNIKVIPSNYDRRLLFNVLIIFTVSVCCLKILNVYYLESNYKLVVQFSIFIILVLVVKNPAIEEVTAMKNYGIQLRKTDGYIIFPRIVNNKITEQTEFIPREKIIDIIINEAFYKWFQVIFYLCILIRDSDSLKIMFPCHLKMKLVDEKLIYNLCREYLYLTEDKIKREMRLEKKVDEKE